MEEKNKYFTTKKISKIAIISALTYILYWLKFPITALFPPFLELNFSDVPALIGGFALGPIAGGIIITVKILLKLPFTSSGCVGELADLIIGYAFILSSSIIYKRNKTLKGAVIGLIVGTAVNVIVAMLANYFIMLPFYGIKDVADRLTLITTAILPFNAMRSAIASVITFLSYKKISGILK